MITRRDALKRTLVLGTLTAAAPLIQTVNGQPAGTISKTAPGTGPHKLPELPYAFDALEPHIDAQTMQIHHGKHHQTYVTNLNKAAAENPELAKKSAEELIRDLNAVPEKARAAVRNNAGGHVNHTWFWQMMKKGGGGNPKGAVASAIDQSFGSFDKFKEEFTKAALGQFGSGWAWLVAEGSRLSITGTPNQDNPLMQPNIGAKADEIIRGRYGLTRVGPVPVLGIDVWEHAYYLKYQNRRADYVNAFFNVINWDFVNEQFAQANKKA